jgi:hypothetical protein
MEVHSMNEKRIGLVPSDDDRGRAIATVSDMTLGGVKPGIYFDFGNCNQGHQRLINVGS